MPYVAPPTTATVSGIPAPVLHSTSPPMLQTPPDSYHHQPPQVGITTNQQSSPFRSAPLPGTSAPLIGAPASSLDFRKDFFFRRRHGQLNWSLLRSVDLERVVRTVDIDALQENVEHITFADITESDLSQLTDANFLQLFRLTQLIIEYLLNVQNFLLASGKKKEGTYEQLVAELDSTRLALGEKKESERALKKELKYAKRIIAVYEKNLGNIKSQSTVLNQTSMPQQASQCTICSSVFLNHDYLIGHFKRRHPNEPLPPAPIVQPPQPTLKDLEQMKVEMERVIRSQLLEAERAKEKEARQKEEMERVRKEKEKTKEEVELHSRLTKLEATLAALMIAPHSLRSKGETDEEIGMRDTLRKHMSDLADELRLLKEERRAQTQPGYVSDTQSSKNASPEVTPMREGKSSTQMINRFTPHAPPRQPQPPSTSQDPPLTTKKSTSGSAHDRTHTLFPQFPGLLARFSQSSSELQQGHNSFQVLSDHIITNTSGMDDVQYELEAQGYDILLPKTEVFVDDYVSRYYLRPLEIIQGLEALNTRERRNEKRGDAQRKRDAELQAKREKEMIEQQKEEAIRRASMSQLVLAQSQSQPQTPYQQPQQQPQPTPQPQPQLLQRQDSTTSSLQLLHDKRPPALKLTQSMTYQTFNSASNDTPPYPTPSPIATPMPVVRSNSAASTPVMMGQSSYYAQTGGLGTSGNVDVLPSWTNHANIFTGAMTTSGSVGSSPHLPSLPETTTTSGLMSTPGAKGSFSRQGTLHRVEDDEDDFSGSIEDFSSAAAMKHRIQPMKPGQQQQQQQQQQHQLQQYQQQPQQPQQMQPTQQYLLEEKEPLQPASLYHQQQQQQSTPSPQSATIIPLTTPSSQLGPGLGGGQTKGILKTGAAVTSKQILPPSPSPPALTSSHSQQQQLHDSPIASPTSLGVLIPAVHTRRLSPQQNNPPQQKASGDDEVQEMKGGMTAQAGNTKEEQKQQRPSHSGHRRSIGHTVAFDASDLEYEHSHARRQHERDAAEGSDDEETHMVSMREQGSGDAGSGGEMEDVHHFSPPTTTSEHQLKQRSSQSPRKSATHAATTAALSSPTPALVSRITTTSTHLPVNQSANFSVANSGDWKSHDEVFDDDIEEIAA